MYIQIDDELQRPGYTKIDLTTKLDSIAYPSQVVEIYCPCILNYVALDEISKYLKQFHYYLRSGGKLIIGGVDCYILSKLCGSRIITEEEYNNLLFSNPAFKCVHSLQKVKSLLQNSGFFIDDISVQEKNARFTIEAIKQ